MPHGPALPELTLVCAAAALRPQKKRLGKSVEEASLDPHITPVKLTAPLLDRMMRIWVMLSQVANMADEHTDYMLTAHHYAVRGGAAPTTLPSLLLPTDRKRMQTY